MIEALWEFLNTDRAANLFALVTATVGAVTLVRWLLAFLRWKRTKLKEDVELLSSLEGTSVQPTEGFVESVEKRTKDLEPRPWLWSFSHLWTLFVIWLYWSVVSKGTFLGPWHLVFLQSLNTFWLTSLLFVFLSDILWCHSFWYRGTRLGIWANRRTKLLGDHVGWDNKRRQAVLLRDYRMGRIHPAYLPDEEQEESGADETE